MTIVKTPAGTEDRDPRRVPTRNYDAPPISPDQVELAVGFTQYLCEGGQLENPAQFFLERCLPADHVLEHEVRVLDYMVRELRVGLSVALWRTLLRLVDYPDKVMPLLSLENQRFNTNPYGDAAPVPARSLLLFCVEDLNNMVSVCIAVGREFGLMPEPVCSLDGAGPAATILDAPLMDFIQATQHLFAAYQPLYALAYRVCSETERFESTGDVPQANAESDILSAIPNALTSARTSLEAGNYLPTVEHLLAAVAMLRDRTSEIANLHYSRDTE
jgi:hypothetical protein